MSGRWPLWRNAKMQASARCGPRPILTLLALAIAFSPAAAETLTGTAQVRERIVLPPDAVFEAVIEDVARAGAPATRLAGTVIEGPGQPPIAFSIDYDPDALDPRAVYSLRATIRQDGRLLFTTDRFNRVLSDGDPLPVEVELVFVQGTGTNDEVSPVGARGLRLPATLRGTLPCADCEGIADHLDLTLRDVLCRARGARVEGQRLEVLSADGRTLAELAAVYLR